MGYHSGFLLLLLGFDSYTGSSIVHQRTIEEKSISDFCITKDPFT